jgi:hypothetical protein
MIYPILALVGLAPAAPLPARAAASVQAATSVQAPGQAPRSPRPKTGEAQIAGEIARSEAAARVADWVASSQDNRSLPYIIIDKRSAALFLFDARGKPLGQAPVLIGVATGDEATPGIGGKNLAEIGPAEKTTPAGRFLARFGAAAGGQRVLWVDYATSVALHPIPPGTKKEHRRERMLSPTADDNRITFGCINVPLAFYGRNVRPLFSKRGGIVYVLPDTKPIEDVFPRLRVQPFLNGANVSGNVR